MSSGDPVPIPPQRLQVLRIIHLSLVIGCLLFGVMAVVIHLQQQKPIPDPPIVGYVGVAVAIMTGLAYLFVPGVVVAEWRRRVARSENSLSSRTPAPQEPDQETISDPYWAMLTTNFLIGAAMLEGMIFLQLVAYLVEGWPWSLVLAVSLWIGLLLKFPTEGGVRRWLETEQELVEHERQRVAG